MSENITINLGGLNKKEREQLLGLVEKAKRSKKIWKPEYGDWYWYISSDGQVDNCEWVNGPIDYGRYSMGNCFRTKEEARIAREKQKIKIELQRFADEHNDQERAAWDGFNEHCGIRYDCLRSDLDTSTMYQFRDIGAIYFDSPGIAKDAANKVGVKRIMKYLFDVDCEVDE